jgi:hypothetical protein
MDGVLEKHVPPSWSKNKPYSPREESMTSIFSVEKYDPPKHQEFSR